MYRLTASNLSLCIVNDYQTGNELDEMTESKLGI
jgi:hypothetical protein